MAPTRDGPVATDLQGDSSRGASVSGIRRSDMLDRGRAASDGLSREGAPNRKVADPVNRALRESGRVIPTRRTAMETSSTSSCRTRCSAGTAGASHRGCKWRNSRQQLRPSAEARGPQPPQARRSVFSLLGRILRALRSLWCSSSAPFVGRLKSNCLAAGVRPLRMTPHGANLQILEGITAPRNHRDASKRVLEQRQTIQPDRPHAPRIVLRLIDASSARPARNARTANDVIM
jgi:hypothetical protein